jgi:hypothetical protein
VCVCVCPKGKLASNWIPELSKYQCTYVPWCIMCHGHYIMLKFTSVRWSDRQHTGLVPLLEWALKTRGSRWNSNHVCARPCDHTASVRPITHRKINGSLLPPSTNVQQPVSGHLWKILCYLKSFREIIFFFPLSFTGTNNFLVQVRNQLTASVSTARSKVNVIFPYVYFPTSSTKRSATWETNRHPDTQEVSWTLKNPSFH